MDRVEKIIITVSNDLSFDQRMQRHANTLVSEGYHVTLVGRKTRQSVPLNNQVFEQVRLNCFFEAGKFFYLEYNLRLFFFLLFSKAHIHLAVDLDTLLPNTLVAKMRNRKLVFDSHEYFTEVPEVYNRPMEKSIWEWVARACIPLTDLRYTVGEALAAVFKEQYGQTFYTIRNLPPKTISEIQKKEAKVILYQGALNKGRALEALILAMKEFNGSLLLAGEGDESSNLRALVDANQLQEKVTFLGRIKPDELLKITQKAWVGYNLLEPLGLSYYYSLANKFFDYIQAGVPQLSPPFPEYQKLNGQCEVAVLVEADTKSILQGLQEIESRYDILVNNCKLASEKYHLGAESEKLVNLFKSLRP